LVLVFIQHHTDMGIEGGERIIPDGGSGPGQCLGKRGFSSIRKTDKADIGDGFDDQVDFAGFPGVSGVGPAGCLGDGGLETNISPTAIASLAGDPFGSMFGEVGKDFTAGGIGNDGTRRNFQGDVFAISSMAAATHTALAVAGLELILESVGGEVVGIFIAQEDNGSAVSAVSAIRTSLGKVFFPAETDAAIPAISGYEGQMSIVNKHRRLGVDDAVGLGDTTAAEDMALIGFTGRVFGISDFSLDEGLLASRAGTGTATEIEKDAFFLSEFEDGFTLGIPWDGDPALLKSDFNHKVRMNEKSGSAKEKGVISAVLS